MIKVLYANPAATVLTGAVCSNPFFIHRGTRQGCPLSPLLFALSLEPLAQAVRQSETISPINIRNTHHHILCLLMISYCFWRSRHILYLMC